MPSSSTKPSKRAQLLWTRLSEWYGTRLAEQYGATPPRDWCVVVDDASDEIVRTVLTEIRMKHPTYPPTFPEFESLFRKAKRPVMDGPSLASRLSDFVLRTKRLTDTQIRTPWLYTRNHDGHLTGVIVQPDGEHPGYRVTVTDLQSSD